MFKEPVGFLIPRLQGNKTFYRWRCCEKQNTVLNNQNDTPDNYPMCQLFRHSHTILPEFYNWQGVGYSTFVDDKILEHEKDNHSA